MLIFAIPTAGLLFSLISLKFFPNPYILISICWSLIFAVLFLFSREPIKKRIWFNLAFFIIILGALEVYSYFSPENQKDNARFEGGYTQGYFTSDEILGYRPVKGKRVRSKKIIGQKLIYDVTYTIGESGLRISPPLKSYNDDRCVLFFGGSFTFGEGVNDHETLPYVVENLSKLKVYNFGFHGYGPHQMLSAIEHGMVERIVDCRPQFAIYQALVSHVGRSAGYSPWDINGPKYILQNGRLEYHGHFDDTLYGYLEKRINEQLNKSFTYRKFLKGRYMFTAQNIQLFLEILDASRNKLIEKYPELEFHVILWHSVKDEDTYQKVRDGLKKKSINYHLLSNMLPAFSENISKYVISKLDKHPNPLAYRLISEYVVKSIIGM